tara:strand:+ start:217 stop:411 length:195 start_codon:yes stop_codon:yes gene_type:complete
MINTSIFKIKEISTTIRSLENGGKTSYVRGVKIFTENQGVIELSLFSDDRKALTPSQDELWLWL